MASQYWLMKTEPQVFSFERLLKEKKTNWDGVRNFQARNFLKQVKKGDLVLIYHSNDDRAVVGIAKCVREGYPDIEAEDGKEWVQVDLAPVEAYENPVPLSVIKSTPALKDMFLIRQSRLSVMPITPKEFEILGKLSTKNHENKARGKGLK
jgi:predicted RNA-binding protein with PUA-like domain